MTTNETALKLALIQALSDHAKLHGVKQTIEHIAIVAKELKNPEFRAFPEADTIIATMNTAMNEWLATNAQDAPHPENTMTKQEQFEYARDNMLKALSDYAHRHGAKNSAEFAVSIAKGLRDINQEGADAIIAAMNEWLEAHKDIKENAMSNFHTQVGTITVDLDQLKHLSPEDKIAIAEAMFGTPPDEDNLGQLLFYTDLMVSSDGEVLVPFEIAPPTEPEHSFDISDEEPELDYLNQLLNGESVICEDGAIMRYLPVSKVIVEAVMKAVSNDIKETMESAAYELTEAGLVFTFERKESKDPYEVEEEPIPEEEEACPPTLRDGSPPVEQ